MLQLLVPGFAIACVSSKQGHVQDRQAGSQEGHMPQLNPLEDTPQVIRPFSLYPFLD